MFRATAFLNAAKAVRDMIEWNGMWARKPHEREFAAARISTHFVAKNLEARGVEKIDVRFVSGCRIIRRILSLISCARPTSWHGPDGHLTIKCYRADGSFVTTHHVFQTDEEYNMKK